MMMPRKQRVKEFFLGTSVVPPPFISFVSSYAARIEQSSPSELLRQPLNLIKPYRQMSKLHDLDAIVNILDTSLEIEEIICCPDNKILFLDDAECQLKSDVRPDSLKWNVTGRVKDTLEMTEKIISLIGAETAVFASIAGPFLLAKRLGGSEFQRAAAEGEDSAFDLLDYCKKINVDLIQRYGKMGVDGLIVIDSVFSDFDSPAIQELGSELNTLWNAIRYYRIPSLFMTGEVKTQEALNSLLKIKADAIIFGGLAQEVQLIDQSDKLLAAMLPNGFFDQEISQLPDSKDFIPTKKSFLCADISEKANINTVDYFLQSIKSL